ncbi:hypothetical protein ABZ351_18220 [Streptomyces microflavus]|uniref:hypothetical protein n=1 Tax=Streptomyces microflavus TaxID=1919 RepID=UPI00340C4BA1
MSKARRHDVAIEMNGFEGRVSIGDEAIRGVRALTYRAEVGERPVLELQLIVHDVTRLSSKDTEILLPNATVKALIALGWTPPQVTDGDQTPGG